MKYKKIMIALAATAALSAAGCGSSSKDTVEVTPTPVPTEAPLEGPALRSDFYKDGQITGTDPNYIIPDSLDRVLSYWCEDKYREICLSLKQHQG